MATLLNIFQQYCALSAKSDGMDSTRFYKFCKEYDLIDGNLVTKSDVDIIYLTHTKNKHVRYLSYTGFNLAITDIAEKKITDYNNLCEYIVAIGRGPTITGTVAGHNRFFDDKSTYTGVYNKGGPTIIDRNASASFWSSEGYHNLKADHDNFHQSAAVSRGAMAVKDYQFMLSQKDNVREMSRASSRHSSPGPSSRKSSASSSSMPKSANKSRRAKVTYTENRTNHFRMTSSVIKPKTDYKLNERISDETNTSLRHYFYLYSSPPGCKSQNGLDGGRFRKFIMDNKKLLLNLKVFRRTEIDILFTKFKDSSISKLTYEGFLCCIQEIAMKYKLRISELTKKIDTAGFSVGPIRDYTQLLPNRFYDDETTYTGVHKAGGLTTIDPNMNAFWGSNGVISPHKLYDKGRREGNSEAVKNYKDNKKKLEPWNTNILFGRLFESYFDTIKKYMSSSSFLKFCRNVEIIDNNQIKLSDIAKLYNYVITEDAKANVDDKGKKVMHLPQFYKALDTIAETRDIDVNELVLQLHDIHINLKTNNSPQFNKIDITLPENDAYENNKTVGNIYNYESNILALQSNNYNLTDNSSEPYEFSPSLVDNSDTKSRFLENIDRDSRQPVREFSSKFQKQSFIQSAIVENEVDIFNTIYELESNNSTEDEKDTVDDESVEEVETSTKNDSNLIITTQRESNDPIMTGFLEKKTDKSNIVVWHRRYFVLLGSGILEYYINELDKVNNIVGDIIDLRGNELAMDEAVDLKYDKIFIKLNNSASQSYLEYVLHADNPSLAALWVQNIKSVYEKYNKVIDNIEGLSAGTKNYDSYSSSGIESNETNQKNCELTDVTPLIYGYLQKKSNNAWMGWQKRYVILRTNGEIVYYAEEGDWVKKPPKGIIDLKNTGIEPDEVLDWNKDKFSITVENGKSKRVYSFIAKDQDLAAKWVQTIKILLNRL